VLGVRPLVSATLPGRVPVRAERYLFQARQQRLPGLPVALLLVHLGGARVSGGRLRRRGSTVVPSFAVFLPPGCASEWTFAGAVDVAGFYLPTAVGDRIARRARLGASECPFSDRLVSALAQQVVTELAREGVVEERYLGELASLLLRQTERVLAGHAGERIAPSRLQLARLRTVLDRIDRGPSEDLSSGALARHAGVSEAYFRRLFAEALGSSPGRYVRRRRLERARELLAETDLPIAEVATECGFSSQSHLTTCFRERHGITPARYRKSLLRAERTSHASVAVT
jgi:AraC family transcriptional regulator